MSKKKGVEHAMTAVVVASSAMILNSHICLMRNVHFAIRIAVEQTLDWHRSFLVISDQLSLDLG